MSTTLSMENFNQMLFADTPPPEASKLMAALKQLTEAKELSRYLNELEPASPAWTGWW